MPSSVQQALCIAEIVRNICEYTDERTLAVLARTCKAYQEPAIQSLWRILPNLSPLVYCLPSTVWEVQNHQLTIREEALLSRSWTTFLKYARHVRKLGTFSWGRKTRVNIHHSVVSLLCALRPTLVLLPNVRIVSWHSLGLAGQSCSHLLSLLGDRVTSIYIFSWNPREETVLRAALAAIESRFPRLRELSVGYESHAPLPSPNHTTIALLSFLASTLPLVSFSCLDIPIGPDAVMRLAQLPTLRYVSIRLEDNGTWPQWRSTVLPFQHLENCLSAVATVPAYIAFSRALPLPNISDLQLRILRSDAPTSYSALFEAIRYQFSTDVFTTLRIEPHEEAHARLRTARASETVVRSVDFAPLLEFTKMTAFDFSAECRHALDDELFLGMVNAWPALVDFSISEQHYCAYEPHGVPTLRALIHLAARGRNLVTIRLRVDAEECVENGEREDDVEDGGFAEEFYGELAHKASPSRVINLSVGMSRITEQALVTVFLARIFPSLCNLYHDDFDHDEEERQFAERWTEVARYVPLLYTLRIDERRRIERNSQTG
ncbi:hypothetical protein C8Q76DRAFT_676855 [Earliella scabrosa]|nr:hypothetical protein C8Q76DRAFT_676855 [Earliella scabrosa]